MYGIPYVPRWLGVIIYITFLFMVIVVLLNLLIAQMSDTYANVQLDAQRSLAINRAWIVARVEHNTLLHIVSTNATGHPICIYSFKLEIPFYLSPNNNSITKYSMLGTL